MALDRDGVLTRQDCTVLVQFIGRDAACVLPVPHALVPDELRRADRLVKRSILPGFADQPEFHNDHGPPTVSCLQTPRQAGGAKSAEAGEADRYAIAGLKHLGLTGYLV